MSAETEDRDIRHRTIGLVEVSECAWIDVDHIYDGHDHDDPGSVGIAISHVHEEEEGETGEFLSAIMAPEVALLLAERITRAARAALEAGEDPVDPQREFHRHTRNTGVKA